MKNHWLLGLGLVVLIGLVAGTSVRAEPISASTEPEATVPAANESVPEVAEAIEKFKNRDFSGALDALKRARETRPDMPPAEVIMAQLFAQANQAGGVRVWLERAVIAAPTDPAAYLILGDLALRGSRVTEAALLFDKANSLMAGVTNADRKKAMTSQIYAGLAAVAEARGDWKTAQMHLESLLKLDDKNAAAMQRLARALFRQDQTTPAYEQLKAAKLADENVLTPALQMALLYDQAGDAEQARKFMEFALGSEREDLKTQLVGAQWMLNNGEFDEALKVSTRALTIDPKSIEAKILRGVVALFMGDFAGAEKYFEEAHLQSPSSFAPSNNLALALCEQDDETKKRRALEYASANARQYRQGQFAAEAASTYGWVLYKLGQVDDADRVLTSLAQSTGNVSPDTAFYIAQISADKGRKDQAKQILTGILTGKRQFSKKADAQRLLDSLK